MSFIINEKQKTPVKIKKKCLIAIFFLYLSVILFSLTLFRFHSEDQILSENPLPTSNSSGLRTPANVQIIPINPYMVPAGTQMVIPPWILEQYQLSQQQALYGGDILNFLIYNYGVAAPSGTSPNIDTYYIPLNVYDSVDYDDGTSIARDTVMVDVTKLVVSNDSPENRVLKTTEEVDTRTGPDVPDPKPVRDLTKIYPVSCDKPESETEAGAPCATCIGVNSGELTGFLTVMKNEVQRIGKDKSFSTAIENFCKTCGEGIIIEDFVRYIEGRAEEEKVPPEIMLGIMLRESNGECNASNRRTNCKGLFQMNMKNSTVLKPCKNNKPPQASPSRMKEVCQGGEYRREGNYRQSYDSLPTKVPFVEYKNPYPQERCLNNPYCNFEESIHLLKGEKWSIGNKEENNSRVLEGKKRINKPSENKSDLEDKAKLDEPSGNSWGEMDYQERNRWRNAIISYNGAAYLWPAERAMKNRGQTDSASLNNWELKRMFFIREYLNASSYVKAELIENLAYVERIAGRETPDGFANSSICQWTQFRKQNSTLSCK